MALYCSREVFEALDGMQFPATKDDLLDFAELKDAREAVVVMLNELPDNKIFRSVSEVCENASITCNRSLVMVLSGVVFPANREALIHYAERQGASKSVLDAIEALPAGYSFRDIDEICRFVL